MQIFSFLSRSRRGGVVHVVSSVPAGDLCAYAAKAVLEVSGRHPLALNNKTQGEKPQIASMGIKQQKITDK